MIAWDEDELPPQLRNQIKPTKPTKKPRKPRTTPEADLQQQITQYAELKGIHWAHQPTREHKHGGHHTANQGTPGLPDLILAANGQTTLLELKAPGKKPTKQQHTWLQASGGHWTDNLDQAIKIIDQLAHPNPPRTEQQ